MRVRDVVAPIVCGLLAVALIWASIATGRVLLGTAGGACAVLAVILALGPFLARRIFRMPKQQDDDTPGS
jgi:Kef-type K+ transport system membrane component KefB